MDRTQGLDMEAVFEGVKNWGRWGQDDQRGALNLITEERIAPCCRPGAQRPNIELGT